jgi:hypothetical protein
VESPRRTANDRLRRLRQVMSIVVAAGVMAYVASALLH